MYLSNAIFVDCSDTARLGSTNFNHKKIRGLHFHTGSFFYIDKFEYWDAVHHSLNVVWISQRFIGETSVAAKFAF